MKLSFRNTIFAKNSISLSILTLKTRTSNNTDLFLALFDYWLGDKNSQYLFQDKARLEISGILKGTKSKIDYREKIKQTQQSNHLNLPAYIVVVEFSLPKSQVTKK